MKHPSVPVAQRLIVLIAVLLAPAPSHAQADRGGFRLAIGVARHGQTDLMASPLRYRGAAAHGTLGYRRVADETRLELAASFSALTLESRISDTGSHEDLYLTALRVGWVRRVAVRDNWQGFVGGRLDIDFPLRRHEYRGPYTELFGDLFVPLQVAGAHELRLSPDLVAWQTLALPLVALVLRTPYAGLKYFPDVSVEPPGRLIGLDHAIGADWALGGPWSARAEWRTRLLRYPDPRELSMVTHRVEVGIEVRP